MNALEQEVIKVLRTIRDPELPVSIYDMGLIYNVKAENGNVHVRMTLTAPNCPVAESLPKEVETRLKALPGVEQARVEIVFDPPWTKDKMSDAAKLELGMDDVISIKGLL